MERRFQWYRHHDFVAHKQRVANVTALLVMSTAVTSTLAVTRSPIYRALKPNILRLINTSFAR